MTPIQGPNRDFASELYINKIVNGQMRGKLDKTISNGSREFSADLHSDANDMNHVSTGLENAQVYALSRQNTMTEVQHMLVDIKKLIGDALEASGGNPPVGSTADTRLSAAVKDLTANINKLLGAEDYDGVNLFGDQGKSFDGGMGITMQVGDKAMDTLENAFGRPFNEAVNAANITYDALYALMDGVIGTTAVEMADMTAELSMLDTRAQAVDNMSASLRNTADTSFVIVTKV